MPPDLWTITIFNGNDACGYDGPQATRKRWPYYTRTASQDDGRPRV